MKGSKMRNTYYLIKNYPQWSEANTQSLIRISLTCRILNIPPCFHLFHWHGKLECHFPLSFADASWLSNKTGSELIMFNVHVTVTKGTIRYLIRDMQSEWYGFQWTIFLKLKVNKFHCRCVVQFALFHQRETNAFCTNVSFGCNKFVCNFLGHKLRTVGAIKRTVHRIKSESKAEHPRKVYIQQQQGPNTTQTVRAKGRETRQTE